MTNRLALIALLTLAGCETIPAAPENVPFNTLAGTEWQLIEMRSSAGVSQEPVTPSRYTLSFAAGGTASMQLDCNRGTASWSNPISNATGGSLRFGPIASTRAMCPPPTLGEMLGRQLEQVRSFRIDDGKLFMSLDANGGTIVWDRVD